MARSSHLLSLRGRPAGVRHTVGRVHGDPSLQDQQLQEEIDLVGALVLAASQTAGPLTSDQIDEILGITPVRPEVEPVDPAPAG
jgi:hypothetical protein